MIKKLLFGLPLLPLVFLLFFVNPLSSQTPIEEEEREYEFLEVNQECLKCHGHTYYYYYND